MRPMYLEDIAHKRENHKMDLWSFPPLQSADIQVTVTFAMEEADDTVNGGSL